MSECFSQTCRNMSITLAVLALWPCVAIGGPTQSQLQEQDMRLVQNFRLTPEFWARYEAYQEDAAKDPCALDPAVALSQQTTRSLDQAAAAFDARPGVHAALQRHQLTAREILLGMTVWLAAAAQDLAAKNPESARNDNVQTKIAMQPENMAFYRQHKDEFHRHQMQLVQQMRQSGKSGLGCLR